MFVLAYPRGMGMGDVKLAAVLGLFLGREVAVAILAGVLAGALVGGVIMARVGVQEGRKTAVPFGPFLALGGIIALAGRLADRALVPAHLRVGPRMRKLIAIATFAVALGLAPAAGASTGISVPLTSPKSMTTVPPGFASDARQAIDAAKATSAMQALHRREHPLGYTAQVTTGLSGSSTSTTTARRVAEVDVNSVGQVTNVWTGPLAIAQYARGHYAPIFDSPWVVVPFALLFLVPFLDPRRLRAAGRTSMRSPCCRS